ncbi:MAG: hypothetical protein M3Z09_00885 [Acidobacteriota bacterium]|nr:hypothetical protein [Acidobacteriota bacterium]
MKISSALLLALLLAVSACKNKDRVRVQTEEEPARLASMLAMSDPRANAQLITGWYPLEQNAWRWTAGHFSVVLRPPIGSEQSGATLKLKLNVPQPVIDKMKSTTLTATVSGTALPPETYTKSGDYEFVREVPAALLKGDSVKVDFALDKYLAAGAVEGRELGVIATAVGFEHK